MRMTIHLIPTDDAGWWLPLFEPGIEKWSRRRLEQLGMPARIQEKALREVVRMLEQDGPLTRTEVGNRLRGRRDQARQHDPRPHHGAGGHLGHRLPRPRPQGSQLPRPAPGLARQAAAVRPRGGAGRARAPLPERLRPRHRPRLRLLVGPCRWGTCGPGSRRSRGELEEVRVGEETLLALGQRPRGCRAAGRSGCSAASTPTCSATRTAVSPPATEHAGDRVRGGGG